MRALERRGPRPAAPGPGACRRPPARRPRTGVIPTPAGGDVGRKTGVLQVPGAPAAKGTARFGPAPSPQQPPLAQRPVIPAPPPPPAATTTMSGGAIGRSWGNYEI